MMLLPIITHPAYILACVLIALAGTKRRAGFFGFLLISALLTPLVGLFILVAGDRPAPRPRRKRRQKRHASPAAVTQAPYRAEAPQVAADAQAAASPTSDKS